MRSPSIHLLLMLILLILSISGKTQPPNISSFSPLSGPVGTTVVITGSGFSSVAANNTVHFGPVQAAITSATATKLTVIVPAGAAYQSISVWNKTTRLLAYSSFPFTTTFEGCAPLNSNTLLPAVSFTAGTTPRSVFFGDLDKDGRSDIMVSNTASTDVSVYRNTSTPGAITTSSFSAKIDLPSGSGPGSGPSGMAVGDIDGDGRLDMVVANYNAYTISTFLNTSTPGNISFAPKTDFSTLTNPLGIAIGDIDGDGKPDLAVANFSSLAVTIYRNTSTPGNASFAIQTVVALAGPRELALADINGDGKADLVVANETVSALLIYRNISSSGLVAFDLPVSASTGNNPRGLSIGDADGDGKLDIAVVNTAAASVSVFRNTSASGVLSFDTKTDYVTGPSPREVAFGDLDGDGRPEIAATANGNARLSVYRNVSAPGSISFTDRVDFTTGNNPLSVNIVDLDNDGKMDVAVTSASSGTIGLLANNSPISNLTTLSPATVVANSLCDNSIWKTLYHSGTSGVVASIKDNGNNLGTISASVYVEPQPGNLGAGQYFIARHYVVNPSTQPSSPVQVRLYFTDAELAALMAVDPSVHSSADLNITKYSGPDEDGTFGGVGGVKTLIPNGGITTGRAYGVNYLEFSTSNFSEFWIHGGSVVLPASLHSFRANKVEEGILLQWTIEEAQKGNYFLVERSSDGSSYFVVGNVASGNSEDVKEQYQFVDKNPATGINYYRLQQVNPQGRKKATGILTVRWTKTNELTVSLVNESYKKMRAVIQGNISGGDFFLHDAQGSLIKHYKLPEGNNNHTLHLDLQKHGSGIYFYRVVTADGIVSTGKIIGR